MTNLDQVARDCRGHWLRGVSGNPSGRPLGSKNRGPRRRAGDLARGGEWNRADWAAHYKRVFLEASGTVEERRAAARIECMNLWRVFHPPRIRPGQCPGCGRSLDPFKTIFDLAPVPFEGVFVHWSCIRQVALDRWGEAKEALRGLGVPVGDP